MTWRPLFLWLWLPAFVASAQVKRPAGGNLVLDGGFERGAAGWSFLVSGAAATGGLDETEKHEGRYSYKLTNRSGFAPNVYARIVQTVSGLQPFTTYKVSCWVKGKGCGITWIGGGPGWYTRTAFPKGDFDWQPVSFEVEAGATPDSYELMVLSESQTEALWVDDIRFEPVRTNQASQDAAYAQLDRQVADLKRKLAALREPAQAAQKAGNPYLRLGTAVVERFVGWAETGGPGGKPSLGWTRLQLEEAAQVIEETERLAQTGPSVLAWKQPSPGAVKLKDGIFYRHNRPFYFAGYGHFDAVIQDLPNFPALGASLIQDGRAGPSAMNADGTLAAGATNVLLGLDRAAQYGMREDFLLSPHYYPDWGGAPDLRNGNIGFLGFNIFHPRAKEVVGKWAQVMARRLKDKPALHSVCLANEPVYNSSGRDPYTRPDFVRYLRERHSRIDDLNALYGTHYAGFEEVPVPPDAMPASPEGRRAYYDWTCFNKEMFAGWHAWLGSLLKREGLKAPTHTKIMVFFCLDRDKLGWGVDPELMCDATDLAGCDAYSFMSGAYAYDWLSNEFFYDLLHSFRGQPVFNSENHIIPDGSGPAHIPMNHTRSSLWQGGLHHQGSTTIWVWEQAADQSLAGSIYFRPANVYGAGRAMEDLNRLAPEVAAINQAKPTVALLYSPASIFWQEKYRPAILSLYTALNFLGQNVTFVSERQLARGTAAKVQWLVVPQATHVQPGTLTALAKFTKSGGKVLLVGGQSLRRDPYDRPLGGAAPGYPSIEPPGSEPALADALRQALAPLPFDELRDLDTGKPAWGIEFRVVRQNRRMLAPLINFNQQKKTVQFPAWAGRRALDLLSGEEVSLDAIALEPMLPRLLELRDLARNTRGGVEPRQMDSRWPGEKPLTPVSSGCIKASVILNMSKAMILDTRRAVFPVVLLLTLAAGSASAQIVNVGGPLRRGEARPPLFLKLSPGTATSSAPPYTPAQVRHAYGFDRLAATGAGTTIAIVDAYGSRSLQSDFNKFCSTFGLPAQTIQVVYAQGKPGPNNGWAQETSLDVQWAHAIAPGAKILLVVAQTASINNLLGAVDKAVSLGATVVSMSWGAGESSGLGGYDYHFNRPGVTFVASAGDAGEQVEWPAVSPYVVGVGGTSLYLADSQGTYLSESAWSGSGGGISLYTPAPAYQSGWSGLSQRCVPDVSYLADPNTGVSVVYNGGWYQFGGTSVGAPQWAAVVALAGGLKNGANNDLYSVAGTPLTGINSSYFFDITSGNNGADVDDFAIASYDLVTGLGSPAAGGLVPALTGK